MPRVEAGAAKDEGCGGDVRRALKERAQSNTSLEYLHHKYGIPKSTLCERARGTQSPPKSAQRLQALTPATEDALEKWTLRMDSQGFPPRLDLFNATTEKLFQQQLCDKPNAIPKISGQI